MASGEDWLMRPVLSGAIRYESLKDGSIDLGDIARLNDAMDVAAENERRALDAAGKNNGR